ncbi:thiamine pyrophosphate-dependent dehydrogenase E1 component subunit alpha [Orrella daihaiensis]|uniref:Thiamine pyrophosphate-dependent dehydrogenase E1 component subunit alpha n=1 Tax=Orrella daihaiensis TaxID=2782176 RepID=A0ABY4AMQ2_9BURK|nr:thiamine pyrophosphate-dependent dehydrogenase E1 component subunit alpha [Orrella daihaiensis]UOD51599.1 thiamine pyrophosphate-dependent dehydrogenase E1 component subunit alpha [Orrella daihaiensis]
MVRIRAFEDAAEDASQGGVAVYGQATSGRAKVRGPLHLSTGQEAVAAGVCAHLTANDYITSTHRGHGHTLAKGADMTRMMCELFGKAHGFNGGRGGSMHIADFSVGMLGANGVVGAGMPIAVGAAHAQKIQGRPDITACFFGDGAINRGPFLESLNWAQVYRLPVLFVCEDNQWSATTATSAMSAGAGAAARARSMDIEAVEVDGNDVLAVYRAAQELVNSVRKGDGPKLLHTRTYRVKGHVSVDKAAYRNPSEVEQALARCPIKKARALYLTMPGARADVLDQIEADAQAEIEAALAYADACDPPDPETAYTHIQTVGAGQWH